MGMFARVFFLVWVEHTKDIVWRLNVWDQIRCVIKRAMDGSHSIGIAFRRYGHNRVCLQVV